MLHEDRDILVVDKPAGLLTMGTDSDKTLARPDLILTDYVRRGTASPGTVFSSFTGWIGRHQDTYLCEEPRGAVVRL